MTEIKLKRVYEDYNENDGYRVLVDKLWPRGIKKEYLHYDLWAKNMTPSTDLRKFFHEDPTNRWEIFATKYNDELETLDDTKTIIEELKKHSVVTLLYASKDPVHNHAIILKNYLDKELNNSR